jgi:hypothetical protein
VGQGQPAGVVVVVAKEGGYTCGTVLKQGEVSGNAEEVSKNDLFCEFDHI